MWTHFVFCSGTPTSFLSASATSLILCILFLHVAWYVRISPEAATYYPLMPAPSSFRTSSHSPSSSSLQSVFGGSPVNPVFSHLGSPAVPTAPRAHLPYAGREPYFESSQRVTEPIASVKDASETKFTRYTASTQPSRPENLLPSPLYVTNRIHPHKRSRLHPLPQYATDVKELYLPPHMLSQGTQVQFDVTRQPGYADEGERTEGLPTHQRDVETMLFRREHGLSASQQKHQAQPPFHGSALPRRPHFLAQSRNELQQHQQGERKQGRSQTDVGSADRSGLNSFNLYSTDGKHAHTLQTHSLHPSEGENSRENAWPTSEQAMRVDITVQQGSSGSHVPWIPTQHSLHTKPSFYNSELDEPVKISQVTDCPPSPPNSPFTYICATAVSTVQANPGLCRLPCQSPQRGLNLCSPGQTCVSTGGEAGICLDDCPPDGLPPCNRRICGPLQICVKNYCRTPGALIDPGLCTPVLLNMNEDFFCDGSRSNPIEH